MGEVIGFGRAGGAPSRIMTCDCGCQTFELVEGGSSRCAYCGAIAAGGWTPPDEGKIYQGGEPYSIIAGEDGFSRRRMLALVSSGDVDAVAVWGGGYRSMWRREGTETALMAERLRAAAAELETPAVEPPVKRAGRKRPYSVRGVARHSCVRCGERAAFQWNACADDNLWRPICLECDIALNRLVLDWMGDPDADAKASAYADLKRAEKGADHGASEN